MRETVSERARGCDKLEKVPEREAQREEREFGRQGQSRVRVGQRTVGVAVRACVYAACRREKGAVCVVALRCVELRCVALRCVEKVKGAWVCECV